ncbi:MAG: hypothetical protein ACT4NY_21890 [Pseudonocardiales bacterium]
MPVPTLGVLDTSETRANMTDENRALLAALAQVTDACHKFGLGIADNNLSQQDHIEMPLMFLDLADRVLQHVVEKSAALESEATCTPG